MAERIVSPGVFTREKDLSFLPQGIADIGAAIIGPTLKGPAFVPTQVTSFSQFENIFGGLDNRFYVPYTVKEYIKNAPAVTIVRVLGLGGYQSSTLRLTLSSSLGTLTAAVLKPSRNAPTFDLGGPTSASLAAEGDWSSASLTIGENSAVTVSFDTGSANYITKVFGTDPQTTNTDVYVYKNFKYFQSNNGFDANVSMSIVSASSGEDFTNDYSVATTPYIVSQLSGGSRRNLFKVNTRSHGSDVNDDFKIAVADLTAAGSVPGSDYGSFALRVLRNNPGENNDGEVLEEFTNLNFDPDSVNYAPRAIGDRYVTIDSEGKLTYNGDWPNKSVHIYLSDYETNLEGINEALLPHGFAAATNPVLGTTTIPSASFVTSQTSTLGVFDQNVYYGWAFNNDNNKQYLAPLPDSAGSGNNAVFSLENMLGHADASSLGVTTYADGSENLSLSAAAKAQLKFVVPFQGGFDGDNPTTLKATGNSITSTNTQGFDCSGANKSGSVAYKRAINAISNPDEFDVNLLVTPGIIHEYHNSVTNHGISKVESRADAFYVMDGSRWGRSVNNAVSDINSLDTNYAAVYYPWVKILDEVKNKPMWVPPSVVLPGVISFNDSVAHEWFAPAGLNRGGLSSVLEAKTRLTHTERDELYEGRVNPIASFPGQGVVVFGQKTLQGKPSALDRINVRRLLIRLRKFIASSSRYLVFEQNTAATRNRFLGIVNPYLSQVQQNSGLSAFKVVMDESNNTPDVVDRNQLVGQIFLQPTRTAEFIVLDFVIQPTGAAFPE
jgi:phage tail sheath protein FI